MGAQLPIGNVHKLSLKIFNSHCKWVQAVPSNLFQKAYRFMFGVNMNLYAFWNDVWSTAVTHIQENWKFVIDLCVQNQWGVVHPWHGTVANLWGRHKDFTEFNENFEKIISLEWIIHFCPNFECSLLKNILHLMNSYFFLSTVFF